LTPPAKRVSLAVRSADARSAVVTSEPDPSQPEPLVDRPIPRPPAYAWRWLQRSRPVLRAIAERLIGAPPPPGFVDELRQAFEADAFTRTIVVDVIAEVAFGGRVPRRQPAGAFWDRGLRWWAATLAGVDVTEFEASTNPAAQPDLFGEAAVAPASPQPETPAAGAGGLAHAARRQVARVTAERAALARSLRQLLDASDGGHIPASAVRQLIAELEGSEACADDQAG
jgi:hypothetical protein